MRGKRFYAVAVTVGLCLGLHATDAAAAPKKINSCTTLTDSSYVLANDLHAVGDCLLLENDFITIDFAGFGIYGNGTGSGIKWSSNPCCAGRGIEIRDGTIGFFARGIDLKVIGGAPGVYRIERMRVVGNSHVGVITGLAAIVKDSFFHENGSCIFVRGCPPAAAGGGGINVGPESIVTGNTSTRNTGDGIVVGRGSTVIGNTVNLNGANGLVASDGSTIVNNTVRNNTGIGLAVTCPSNILGNTATSNGANLVPVGAGCNSEHNLVP